MTVVSTGIDVSGNNGSFKPDPKASFRAVKAAGHSWCYIKATEGETYAFSRLASWADAAKNADLWVGAYHFAQPGVDDARREADHYLRHIAGIPLELAPVLDLETATIAPGALVKWALAWTEHVQAATGRQPMLYTYTYFWKSALAKTPALSHLGLWQADYRAKPENLPPWPQPDIWQYTGKGSVPGITGHVDLNRANVTILGL